VLSKFALVNEKSTTSHPILDHSDVPDMHFLCTNSHIKVSICSVFVYNACTEPLQTSGLAETKRYCKLWILWDYLLLNEAVRSDRANSSML